MKFDLKRRVTAEFLGTAFLLMAIVGSGIMAEKLSGGNAAVALLGNTVAIATALFALITVFGEISGAHFNPAVTLCAFWQRDLTVSETFFYILAQFVGALGGTAAANLMFEFPAFFAAQKARTGAAQWSSEMIATLGLMSVIFGCTKLRAGKITAAVIAAYVAAAIWFTSSTAFANPAVTLARSLTDTFTGIRVIDVFPFVAAQLFGAFVAVAVWNWMIPRTEKIENL